MKRKIFLLLLLFLIPLKNVFASSDIYINCPNGGEVGSTLDCELFVLSDIEISAVSTKLSVSDNLEFVSFKTESSWQGTGDNGDIALYTYPNQIGEIKLGIITIKIKESNVSRIGTLYAKEITFFKADFSGINGKSNSKNIKILSSNNDLASLSLINYNITPKFNQDITEYQATVDSDVVVIEASSKDDFATISGIGRKELKYGENIFEIIVTSETNAKKIYKLFITRPKNLQDENISKDDTFSNQDIDTNKKDEEIIKKEKDSKLKNLIITGYDINFRNNTYNYYIDISDYVESLEIIANPNSDKAKVTIQGNEHLVIGKNEITITVEAEDGSISIYTVYVTKKSNSCAIKSIVITNYDFLFDCNKYEYELQIGADDNLNIEIIPTNDQAKVQIFNNNNLKNKDVIKLLVTDNDIEYKYYIKVFKNNVKNSNILNNKKFILISSIIILGSLYLVGRYLMKKRILHRKK